MRTVLRSSLLAVLILASLISAISCTKTVTEIAYVTVTPAPTTMPTLAPTPTPVITTTTTASEIFILRKFVYRSSLIEPYNDITIRIPESTYNYYRSLPTNAWFGQLSLGLKDIIIDPTIESIVADVKLKVKGDDQDLANALLDLARNIPYFDLKNSYRQESTAAGIFTRAPQYPVELLVDGKVNCASAAIICATLMYAANLDVVLIAWKQPDNDYLGHVVVGVHLSSPPTYSFNQTPLYLFGKEYYIADATGDGNVGDRRLDLDAGGWYAKIHDTVQVQGIEVDFNPTNMNPVPSLPNPYVP